MVRFACCLVVILVLAGCGGNDDPTPNEVAVEQIEQAGGDTAQTQLIAYFLIFPSDEAARRATTDLRSHGFTTNAEYTAGFAEEGEGWLVVEKAGALADLEQEEALLSDLATKHGGQYDGWEAAP